ncbi:MAG: alkaline phosphatase D family protein, partial [Armatimonadetes bacterium]|nr:alkaline phosphatase D family protein [Armatimonadota bacterium]
MDKKTLTAVMRDPVSRREFLSAAGMTTALLLAGQVAAQAQANNSAKLPSDPFTLGVASGDPLPGGVVLWTRLAPNPLNGGWDSTRSRSVRYQVALDPNFRRIVQQGAALALPQENHSVHVELRGLQPASVYFYRFIVDNYTSRVGRTKTAPATGAPTDTVKFAFCSCSDYQNGFFGAYRAMANEDLDFWIHLGDYIYEYDAKNSRAGYNPATDALNTRQHSKTDAQATPTSTGLDQLTTLTDYRNRHAQYKLDPDLQLLHASSAMICVWDDHEVENNYATDIDDAETPFTPADQFLLQRAAAYQAYYENMPMRRGYVITESNGTPRWRDAQLYRNLQFGNLLSLNMLDTRQYRTDQVVPAPIPNIGDFSAALPAGGNPTGTLLGQTQ